jgi:hypothetical protein
MKASMTRLLLFSLVMLTTQSALRAQPLQVDCNAGGTLTQALQTALPGETILVTGTCQGFVTLATDRIAVDGQGTAVIQDGGFILDGARGVTLTGFTIQNSPANGVLAYRGAALLVANLTIEDSAGFGLIVTETATATISNCTVRRSALDGISVGLASSLVIATGSVESHDNRQNGLSVVAGGSGLIAGPGATLAIHDNVGHGIFVGAGGLQVLDPAAELTTEGNGGDGIHLISETGLGFGILGGTLSAARNQGAGIRVIASSLGLRGGTVSLTGNADSGLVALFTSKVVTERVANALYTISGNTQAGVMVDDSSVYLDGPIIVENNRVTDVALSFGAHATLLGERIGRITCEASSGVLIRGRQCP